MNCAQAHIGQAGSIPARLPALILLSLCGCVAQQPPKPDVSALLKPCPIAEPRRYTAQEVTRVGNARKDALIACNRDKAEALHKLEKP